MMKWAHTSEPSAGAGRPPYFGRVCALASTIQHGTPRGLELPQYPGHRIHLQIGPTDPLHLLRLRHRVLSLRQQSLHRRTKKQVFPGPPPPPVPRLRKGRGGLRTVVQRAAGQDPVPSPSRGEAAKKQDLCHFVGYPSVQCAWFLLDGGGATPAAGIPAATADQQASRRLDPSARPQLLRQ